MSNMTLMKFSRLSLLLSAISTLVGWVVFTLRVGSNSTVDALTAGIIGLFGTLLIFRFFVCPRRAERYHGLLDVHEIIPDDKRFKSMMQITLLLPMIMNGYAVIILLCTTVSTHSVGWIVEAGTVITGSLLGTYWFYRDISKN